MPDLRHHFFLIPTLLVGLLIGSATVWAQANEAPVTDPVPPGWGDPGSDSTVYGSATGPTSNPWSTYLQGCTGIACLTRDEQLELNELCKLAGDRWREYALCEKLAASLLAPQP